MADRARVLITGMGAVTPMGTGVEALWEGLISGRDAIGPIERFDTTDYRVKSGGVVPDVDFDFPEDPKVAEYDLGIRFCARAIREALESAGLARDDVASSNAAIVLATNFGQAEAYQDVCQSALHDTAVDVEGLRQGLLEFAPRFFAELWGVKGPRAMLSLSCASGNAAVSYATELLRTGRAELAIAGGFDVISEFAWSGLLALRTMTTKKITPFDRNRSGTIFGEGAGVMILETEEHACAREAEASVEVAGHHTNNNAFHLTAPQVDGAVIVRAMLLALEDAGLSPGDVDHVNSHGTATRYNDKTETATPAVELLARAQRLERVLTDEDLATNSVALARSSRAWSEYHRSMEAS